MGRIVSKKRYTCGSQFSIVSFSDAFANQDMNKVKEAYGCNKHFNTPLIFSACIIWLAFSLLAVILIVIAIVVSEIAPSSSFAIFVEFALCVWSFLWCPFMIVIYWFIRKHVFEFIDIKASLEG